MVPIFNKPNLKEKGQHLRKDTTPFEKMLWIKLRWKQFFWIKWRRQFSVWNYILDFYSPEIKTCLEIDWDIHSLSIEYDNTRTLYLNQKWIKVIRYANSDIRNNLEWVLEDMRIKLIGN
ncbi:MAG: hypothetical protein ACD_3C00090G0001 [uncultured bacterium (gcode 4)]|uniref:DUF559 domain-containing protein n=1 Tax=uncultured bacterium (gcode 4) TaxID=1234023 RepID=K2G1R8_9BACT|nr:MAG: hypothetical protein ACD_3C00090G0001 [uncultured bacterium (gcode 4)]